MDEHAFYRQLIERYQQNRATDEELELFFHLLKEGKLDGDLLHYMSEQGGASPVQTVPPAGSGTIRRLTRVQVAAASVLLVALASLVYYFTQSSGTGAALPGTAEVHKPLQDAAPGTNKAVLTLGDGRRILLDSTLSGVVAQQAGTTVIKQGGQLAYTASSSRQVVYNTITTPRGGQYQVVLPDGTRVWLNAASSLRFPTTFTGTQRKVEVSGEAYFEVATRYQAGSTQKVPFVVQILSALGDGGRIEVLGTHFNVMAYDDEASIRTTLLEGQVKVTRGGAAVLLTPGQQARLERATSDLSVSRQVDVQAAVAWKNGLFLFDNTPLSAILRQAARWYDVDVVYEGILTDETFSGRVPRMQQVSALLKVLELTRTVKFSVEGKKIIVHPYSEPSVQKQ